MEESGCEIICGAPTTLAVKGEMMMMMMMFVYGCADDVWVWCVLGLLMVCMSTICSVCVNVVTVCVFMVLSLIHI